MNFRRFLTFVVVSAATIAENAVISQNYNTYGLPNTTLCGVVKESERIVGGEVTKLGEFPWMAAVEYQAKKTGENVGIRCGGSVINSRYVLTAAACLIYREFEPTAVLLGEWRISTDPDCIQLVANEECADSVEKFQIKDTLPHPFYSRRTGYANLGLIQLENEIVFTDYIRPICLPMPDLPGLEIGTRMTVIGWGATENGSSSDVLLKVEVPLLPNLECSANLESVLSRDQLCAGGERGKDSCEGDTGGPLMRILESKSKEEMHWYLEGVTSWGIRCGSARHPAMYTRISSYISWIGNAITREQDKFS